MTDNDDLEIRVEPSGPCRVVRVAGEIDLSTTGRLQAELDAVLAGEKTDLVIDLTDVTFMDSTGLSVIVVTYRKTRDLGVAFSVVVNKPGIAKLFRLTGLDRAVPLHESVEAALGTV